VRRLKVVALCHKHSQFVVPPDGLAAQGSRDTPDLRDRSSGVNYAFLVLAKHCTKLHQTIAGTRTKP
jgi:hypothetical protein